MGGRVRTFLLERGNKPEKGAGRGVITLQFNHIYSDVGKVKFPVLLFLLPSFELAMQDFYPSLYNTKTLYHWYISDPFL